MRLPRFDGRPAARAPQAVILLALLVLTAYLLAAPDLAIREVRVVGSHYVPQAEILAASGLVGQNVFLASAGQVERGVLALRPIRSVEVTYSWPASATLRVVERAPFGIWRSSPGGYLVSEDGVVLAPAGEENLPLVIADADARPVKVGDTVDAGILAEGTSLLAYLKPLALGVKTLEYSHEYGLIAPMERGPRIAFGRGDVVEKVSTLRAILEELTRRQITAQLIDLRIKDRPYYR